MGIESVFKIRINEEHFILKIPKKLRTASLNLSFNGSYKKECKFFNNYFSNLFEVGKNCTKHEGENHL